MPWMEASCSPMHAPRQMKVIYEVSLIDSHFWMQCCRHCLASALLIEVLIYAPCLVPR